MFVFKDQTTKPFSKVNDFIPIHYTSEVKGIKAKIAITKGCNNFCSFCIVPITRGLEVSRTSESILEETKRLVESGIKEICLLGQNVNSYRDNQTSFVQLLEKLDKIDGLNRIRFISPHPKDFTEDLAYAMKELSKVCEQLHLPLQSGSNKILRKMRRWYTVETYYKKIEMFKKLMPNGTLSTDIIVGFPGEDEDDFENTCLVIKKVYFDLIYAFKYSKRPGTKAEKYLNQVDNNTKSLRLNKLFELQEKIQRKKYNNMIGKEEEVLIEEQHLKESNFYKGRTRGNLFVNVKLESGKEGDVLPVKITGFRKSLLEGIIIN